MTTPARGVPNYRRKNVAETRKNPSNSAAEASDAPDKKTTTQSSRSKKTVSYTHLTLPTNREV